MASRAVWARRSLETTRTGVYVEEICATHHLSQPGKDPSHLPGNY